MQAFAYVSSLPFGQFDESGLVRGVEAFKAGTWRGKKYTTQHLQEMADNFKKLRDEGLLEPPLKVDHSESAKDLIGWVKDLYVEGDSLMADVLFTEEEAIQKVRRGTWKKVSSEIYHHYKEESNGKDYGMVFRALSIVSIPHLKNIRGIVLNAEMLEEDSNMKLDDFKKLLDEKFNEISKDKADFTELSSKLMDEVKSFMEGEVKKYQEQAEKMADEAQKAKEYAEKLEKQIKEKEIDEQVKAFSEAGKIVPAQEEALKKLLGALDQEQTKLFNEFMENAHTLEMAEFAEYQEDDKNLSAEELAAKLYGI